MTPKPKREAATETAVVRWANQRNVLQTKLNFMGRRGWPDRCFWIPGGRPLLVEFKRRGALATPLQAFTIDKLKRLGYDVRIAYSKNEAVAAIRERLNRS